MTLENVIIFECGSCAHRWRWDVEVPMEAGAFASKLKAQGICGKCGNKKKTVMLQGDAMRTAIVEMEGKKVTR